MKQTKKKKNTKQMKQKNERQKKKKNPLVTLQV
jgi:hypothetical protein